MNRSLCPLNFQKITANNWRNEHHVSMFSFVVCEGLRVIPFQAPLENTIYHSVRRSAFPESFFKKGFLVNGEVVEDQSGSWWTGLLPVTWLSAGSGNEYTLVRDTGNLRYIKYDKNKNQISDDSVSNLSINVLPSSPRFDFVRFEVASNASSFSLSDFRFYPRTKYPDAVLKLIDENGTETIIPSNEYRLEAWNRYDLLIYQPTVDVSGVDVSKKYYLSIQYGSDVYTSEYISFKQDVSDLIKITYAHDHPILCPSGQMNYDLGFKSIVYLSAKIGKPSYVTQSNVEERGGNTYISRFVSRLEYRMYCTLPEYLCNALRILGGHKYVTIEKNGEVYTVDKLEFNAEFEEKGDVANVEIVFSTNTTATTHSSQQGELIVVDGNGDFNTDYNTDYSH